MSALSDKLLAAKERIVTIAKAEDDENKSQERAELESQVQQIALERENTENAKKESEKRVKLWAKEAQYRREIKEAWRVRMYNHDLAIA